MKILAFRDNLRDPRNERVAEIAKNLGYDIEFLGIGIKDMALPKLHFSKTHTLNIRALHRIGLFDNNFIELLKQKIDEIDPDVIYAHDIIFARMIYKINPRFLIMDDHEYWTEQIKYFRVETTKGVKNALKSTAMLTYLKNRIPKWQKEIQQKSIIVASSSKIKELHEIDGAKKVYYFPNMPTYDEIKEIKIKDRYEDNIYSSFLGRDISIKKQREYRNTNGLKEIYKDGKIGKLVVLGDNNLESDKQIISKGFLPHMQCYEELTKSHLGILGFKSHPALGMKSAQKIHMYVHSGLIPFVTPEQFHLLDYLQPKMKIYRDFNDLRVKILENKNILMRNDGDELIGWAKENIILDNFKDNLKMAFEDVANN